MKKKSEKTQVAWGRKHSWVDTQGHAHRIVFDEKSSERPRGAWLALGVATFLALAIGVVGVLTAPSKSRDDVYRVAGPSAVWKFARTIAPEQERAQTISAGWNDEFFVANREGVALYNSQGEKLDFWAFDAPQDPTAIFFVADVNSSRNGTLLVAFVDEIRVLRFTLDRVATGEGANLVFTAKGGAKGAFEPFLSIPETDIRDLAATSDRLFIADYAGARVLRYTWSKIEALQSGSDKTLIPDCAIGEPDSAFDYPGLAPTFERVFSIAFFPSINELMAANSGRLRIDSFNASTGAYCADHGIPKNMNIPSVFSGTENPVAIASVGVDRIVAAEYRSPVDLEDGYASDTTSFIEFDLTGEVVSKIVCENTERAPEVSIVALDSSFDGTRLYALYSDGAVDVWEGTP